MIGGGVGISGSTFDAFVSSQRGYNESDWAAKIQEKYWRARQKFLAKIERNEDSSIVLSDAKLDSKLGIYKSIDRSCGRLTSILENYQNSLFVYSNEENALGILLKECGKHDKTKAGKVMSLAGRSLTQSSHQRIRLYMPLTRLHQEMETFHSRAVEDTSATVDKLESKRTQYRASLLWMKDISDKLDPDVYGQLDKFRRIQSKVREDKRAFDGMQMDVVQKIDLLMASRCNLMNQILAAYQAILLETFEKNYNNFKSVEELIGSEDLYEYEFQTLKQLNPLKIDDSPQKRAHEAAGPSNRTDGEATGARGEEQGKDLVDFTEVGEQKSLSGAVQSDNPTNLMDSPNRTDNTDTADLRDLEDLLNLASSTEQRNPKEPNEKSEVDKDLADLSDPSDLKDLTDLMNPTDLTDLMDLMDIDPVARTASTTRPDQSRFRA